MDPQDRIKLAVYRLQESNEALEDASLLLKNERFRACINRCYYAIFYASQALLLLKGLHFKKHSANLSGFQKEFVKEHIFPQDPSRTFSRLFLKRTEGDYADFSDFTADETENAVRDTKVFLDEAKQLFERLIKNIPLT